MEEEVGMVPTKFSSVCVDSDTFNMLGQLCEATGLSKAGYLRLLVKGETLRLRIRDDDKNDPIVKTRNGLPIRLSKLLELRKR
jgi:hypothetical protein